jgi:hypothetical protein
MYSGVFPDLQYLIFKFDPTEASASYDDFMKRTQSTMSNSNRLRTWAILPRHQNAGADKLLDRLVRVMNTTR